MQPRTHSPVRRARAKLALAATGCAGLALSGCFLASVSGGAVDAVGPRVCWVLVAAGIVGTSLASSGRGNGWLLLFGLQPIWIAYAFATGQPGLILGCVAHSLAQMNGFLRSTRTSDGAPPEPAAGDADGGCLPAELAPALAGHPDQFPHVPPIHPRGVRGSVTDRPIRNA
jgi:hypothetical protein